MNKSLQYYHIKNIICIYEVHIICTYHSTHCHTMQEELTVKKAEAKGIVL